MLNINTLATPGVYIDEVSLFPPSVAAVETAIPVFIGYTGKPLNPDLDDPDTYVNQILNKAIKISFFREYEEYFGKPLKENATIEIDVVLDLNQTGTGDKISQKILDSRQIRKTEAKLEPDTSFVLHYAMQHYFQNGGGDCYVISVGNYEIGNTDFPIATEVEFKKLKNALEVLESEDEPTIIVFPEAFKKAVTGDNTIEDGYFSLYRAALDQCEKLKDRVTVIDVPVVNKTDIDESMKKFRAGNIGASGEPHIKFGAAYFPYLNTTINYYFGETDSDLNEIKVSLNLFKTVEGVISKTNEDESNQFLRILNDLPPVPVDPPTLPTPEVDATAPEKIGNLNIKYLKVKNLNDLFTGSKKALKRKYVQLAPSAAIAGIYNKVDTQRGVWKAPANVSLAGVSGLSLKIDDNKQRKMNIDADTGKSVNAVRVVSGRGIVVWGARTLDGNDNEWRYISVRRFFNFVEESIKKATYRFVFEPNDANTWNSIRAMIENFLTIQWNQGALQGAKADQAFFVKVGLGQTMTPQDILEGRLIVEIGMAVVRPAEFIILRFMHKLPEA